MNAPPPYGQPPGTPPPQAPPPYAQAPYAQAPHPPQQPPAPKKKGMSGCLIAVLVLGGLCALGGLLLGFVAWRIANSEEGKKIVNAVSSGAQVFTEARSAPGTAELRALGCAEAFVADVQKLAAIAAQFDAGVQGTGERLFVSCQVKKGSKAPTCDQVAATYVKAVGKAAGSFEAQVAVAGGNAVECTGTYDAEGRRTHGH